MEAIQPRSMQLPRLLSGFALKRIAVISMVIDHIGSAIISKVLIARYAAADTIVAANAQFVSRLFALRGVCDALGSIAFPIFCFLAAEGFAHSKSPLKYGLRMLAFAVISEIPYNLVHNASPLYPALQNVMFTLAVSIITLCALNYIEKNLHGSAKKLWALRVLAIIAGMGLAFIIRGEYVFLGVLTVSLLYLLRNCGYWRLLGFAPLLVVSPWILLALPPVALYNGARGSGSKYFFYVFYPAHFLLLYAVVQFIQR